MYKSRQQNRKVITNERQPQEVMMLLAMGALDQLELQ